MTLNKKVASLSILRFYSRINVLNTSSSFYIHLSYISFFRKCWPRPSGNWANMIQMIVLMGVVQKSCHPFFEIFVPSLPLVTKKNEVTSPFDRFLLSLSGWHHLWMAAYWSKRFTSFKTCLKKVSTKHIIYFFV